MPYLCLFFNCLLVLLLVYESDFIGASLLNRSMLFESERLDSGVLVDSECERRFEAC